MAQGSHTTFGTRDSRTCCICTSPIVMKHDVALRFHHSPAGSFAWHVPCEVEHGWPTEARP